MSVIKSQHIFLPKKYLDFSKWAIIAVDQHTHNPDYWERLLHYTNGSPSSLDLILPEIYQGKDNTERIKTIYKKMRDYNDLSLLEDMGSSMVLVERQTSNNKKRLGIVLNVDLEQYDFRNDSNALIKPTEHTTLERVIPRLELRKEAIYELSHVILLYDDREKNIAKTLYKNRDELIKLYDFDLNMGGGHIKGWLIKKYQEVINLFDSLISKDYTDKYLHSANPLMFVIADGSHSLATAKEHWEKLKVNLSSEEQLVHPARYALVEAINLYDESIDFSPVHRVIKGASKSFVKRLKKLYKVNLKKAQPNSFIVEKIYNKGKQEDLYLPNDTPLAIKMIQDFIDECLTKDLEMSVDYVNSLEELEKICKKDERAIGITFPKIEKTQLFEFISRYGILPRRSYNLCSENEKRYYIEAHKIKMI